MPDTTTVRLPKINEPAPQFQNVKSTHGLISLGDYLQKVRTGEERDSYSSLTEREREILKLVAEGYTNNQIAERLVISPKTVDTHRTHIMDKLNMHSRAELIKYAMRRGLL